MTFKIPYDNIKSEDTKKYQLVILDYGLITMDKNDKNPKRKVVTTSKKQKFVRSKGYIDPDTGEIVPFQEVQIEDRDFNFHKVWLEHFLNSLDGISNQKMRLAFWIINNLNSENQLVMTQDKIAELSKMSIATVKRTMKSLQESTPPFLVKINSGAYQVNPDIVWKGSHKNRMGICFTYHQATQPTVIQDNEELKTSLKPTKPLEEWTDEDFAEFDQELAEEIRQGAL